MSQRWVERTMPTKQAVLGASGDLLAPYLQRPVTEEEECV